jgi:hypothetical protein
MVIIYYNTRENARKQNCDGSVDTDDDTTAAAATAATAFAIAIGLFYWRKLLPRPRV